MQKETSPKNFSNRHISSKKKKKIKSRQLRVKNEGGKRETNEWNLLLLHSIIECQQPSAKRGEGA